MKLYCVMMDKIRFSNIFILTSIVAAVVGAVYVNTLGGGFLYDDEPFIVDNPSIRDLSNLPYFFTSKYSLSESGHSIYRPLRTLSFAIEYSLWGLNPLGYHLTNVALHAVNSAALFLLFRVLGGITAALFAALAFGVHPVQTESVAWVSSRGDLLFSFFALLSFFFYIYRHVAASITFYLLALFSKETAFVLPLVLAGYDYCYGRFRHRRKALLRYAPYLAVGAIYLGARFYVLGEVSQSGFWGGSFARNMMAALKAFLYEMRLIFLPGQLRPIYTFSIPASPFEPIVIVGIAALLLICLTVRKLARRQKQVLFYLSWFFIFLIPSSNILPLKGLLSEHYLYLSMAGASMAAALAIKTWAEVGGARAALQKRRLLACGAAIVIIFATQSAWRNSFWRNDERLWFDSAKKSPSSYSVQNNLGMAYMRKELYNKAIAQYLEAIRLKPDFAIAYNNLGVSLGDLGSAAQAEEAYRKALFIEPKFVRAQSNLGDPYNRMGQREAAKRVLLKALQLDPELSEAHNNLGVSFGEEGFMDKAIMEFLRALRSRPYYAEAWNNLGTAYGALGLGRGAKLAYEKALLINPLYADPHYGLAAMYQNYLGDPSKASNHKEQWEQLKKASRGQKAK